MHYVIQTDQGWRLFATEADALASEGYETPLAVPEGAHYRGTPPFGGVLFTRNDQSSRQFAVLAANR